MAKSNADRQKAYRNAKRNAQRPESLRNAPIVTERDAQPDLYPRAADVRASHAYTPRANPDKLNWGPWMSSEQLAQARLTANRVPIPGDSDYSGVCRQEAGAWK